MWRGNWSFEGNENKPATVEVVLPKMGMTSPRQIIPGATYLMTRRTLERRYFLTPDKGELVDAFKYVVAEAAVFGFNRTKVTTIGLWWRLGRRLKQ